MARTELRDALYPNCPIRNVLSRIGDKWSMLVLFTLNNQGVQRFKELKRGIPDISQKMLTATLRNLEADGLVARHIYPEMPPRVEYSLTPRAETLIPHVNNLIFWAQNNMDDIIAERRKYILKD
jgi:DNA-binding HxlR family transcriptional regulator